MGAVWTRLPRIRRGWLSSSAKNTTLILIRVSSLKAQRFRKTTSRLRLRWSKREKKKSENAFVRKKPIESRPKSQPDTEVPHPIAQRMVLRIRQPVDLRIRNLIQPCLLPLETHLPAMDQAEDPRWGQAVAQAMFRIRHPKHDRAAVKIWLFGKVFSSCISCQPIIRLWLEIRTYSAPNPTQH
jgi:hypothetical protein